MKKYLLEYIDSLEKDIKNNKKYSKEDIELVKTKIMFFQHERLIHLLVTLFYALFTIIFLILGMISWIFIIIFVILLCFVLCYILYYFFLENHVQYLYKLYDKLNSEHK